MRCDTCLCIYQHERLCCIADEARIDDFGRCSNYTPIDLPYKTLREEKHRLLLEYEHGVLPAKSKTSIL